MGNLPEIKSILSYLILSYLNGRTLTDSQEIANAFNTYFISIGPKLATQNISNH